MFHANCWGMPYGAVMLGAKLVFPGPHLHPDDLLDLMQLEPPTLSLGVPTIWLSLIQAYERALAERARPLEAAQGMRSLVGGAAVPEALIRAFDAARHHDPAGLGHDRDVAAGHRVLPARRAAATPARTNTSAAPRWPACRCRWSTLRLRDRRRRRRAVGRQDDGRDPGARAVHHRHLPRACRLDARQVHATTAGCAPATWRRWTTLGYVRITDRTKDLIKSGGEWISSVDLENALMAHPAIAEAAVIAIPRREVERAAAGLRRVQAGPERRRRGRRWASTC